MTTPIQGTKSRKTPFTRELDEDLEALRDDCIALFLNSKLTQKKIHELGGPTPGTISKWLYRETMFPRYHTISAFTHALGCKVVIIDARKEVSETVRTKLARPNNRKPKMPIRVSQKRLLKKGTI